MVPRVGASLKVKSLIQRLIELHRSYQGAKMVYDLVYDDSLRVGLDVHSFSSGRWGPDQPLFAS